MHVGYAALGGYTFADPAFEIVNNARVLSYVEWWNEGTRLGLTGGECINWFADCDTCWGMERFFNDRSRPYAQRRGYCAPDTAPYAPWYSAVDSDSTKFLGVLGIEVKGDEDSVRSATVQRSLTGGGMVSRVIVKPRELLIRALAVAVDEAGLQYGLSWLRFVTAGRDLTDCAGDDFWFLAACPPCAEQSIVNDPCALPGAAPDPESCFQKYMRHFQFVRILDGPKVLSKRKMNSGGWIAEIEILVMAPDPEPISSTYTVFDATQQLPAPTTFTVGPPPPPPPPNEVLDRLGLAQTSVMTPSLPTSWKRRTIALPQTPLQSGVHGRRYSFTLLADVDYDDVRVGIADAHGNVLDGVHVPFLLKDHPVTVDALERQVILHDGTVVAGYVSDFDGSIHHWPTVDVLDGQPTQLIIDHTGPPKPDKLHVEVTSVEVG